MLQPLDLKSYKQQIEAAARSEQRGYPLAALRRLRRLRRSLEKRSDDAIWTWYYVALLHQLEAGIHARSGNHSDARISYLRAAGLAFYTTYAAVDLTTNSLELAHGAAKLDSATPQGTAVSKLPYRGSQFVKEIGDLLNDHLIAAGLRPVIFGGLCPAKVAPKQPASWPRADRS